MAEEPSFDLEQRRSRAVGDRELAFMTFVARSLETNCESWPCRALGLERSGTATLAERRELYQDFMVWADMVGSQAIRELDEDVREALLLDPEQDGVRFTLAYWALARGPALRVRVFPLEDCPDVGAAYFDWLEEQPVMIAMVPTRVMAYQENLLEHLGIRQKVPITAMVHMYDFINVALEDGAAPYGPGLSAKAREASQLRWVRSEVTRLKKTHTVEVFDAEWWRKNQVLARRRTTSEGFARRP